MSTQTAGRRPAPIGGPGRMMMGGGMPPAKLQDFKGTSKRLLRMLTPDVGLVVVMLLAITSVVLNVLEPRLLGRATDVVFEGIIGASMKPGTSKAQAVAGLRAQGKTNLADMLARMNVVPGRGIDFTRLWHVLALVVVVYLASSLFSVMAGRLTTLIVQRFIFRLREQVETKLSRLQLSYFDQQRGDVLSRATNDTDNIAMTLQQTMSQLVTSVLTIVGVLVFMFWISPL